MEKSETTNQSKIQCEYNYDIPQCNHGLQARFLPQPCSNQHNHHGSQEKDMLQRKAQML